MLANLVESISSEPAQRTEYLWPGNVKHWHYWQSVQTQWRSGMGGATGLDYGAVVAYLQAAHRLCGKRLRQALECIRAAERATLDVWAEQAEAAKQNKT